MILLANACQGLTSVVSKIKMDTKEVSSVASHTARLSLPPGGAERYTGLARVRI